MVHTGASASGDKAPEGESLFLGSALGLGGLKGAGVRRGDMVVGFPFRRVVLGYSRTMIVWGSFWPVACIILTTRGSAQSLAEGTCVNVWEYATGSVSGSKRRQPQGSPP